MPSEAPSSKPDMHATPNGAPATTDKPTAADNPSGENTATAERAADSAAVCPTPAPADTGAVAPTQLSDAALEQILVFQQNEVTEAEVYRRIAEHTKDEANRTPLLRKAAEEAHHAQIWERYTGRCLLRQRC